MAASREFTHILVRVICVNTEALDVNENGEHGRNEDVSGQQLDIVVRDVGPDNEVSALQVCTNGTDGQMDESG